MNTEKNTKKTFYKGEWIDELTCKEFVEWVTDYLEDRLSMDDRLRFDAHLAQCSACPNYIEQMRLTIQTVGKLSDTLIEVSQTAKRELLSIFSKWKAEKNQKT
jgi:anti-sigma factor RsiW